MKTEIKLSDKQSDDIGEFWTKHGGMEHAMLAQPQKQQGKYILKIKMLNTQQALLLNNFLEALWLK